MRKNRKRRTSLRRDNIQIAALRFYQAHLEGRTWTIPEDVAEIATDAGGPDVTSDEIDTILVTVFDIPSS